MDKLIHPQNQEDHILPVLFILLHVEYELAIAKTSFLKRK